MKQEGLLLAWLLAALSLLPAGFGIAPQPQLQFASPRQSLCKSMAQSPEQLSHYRLKLLRTFNQTVSPKLQDLAFATTYQIETNPCQCVGRGPSHLCSLKLRVNKDMAPERACPVVGAGYRISDVDIETVCTDMLAIGLSHETAVALSAAGKQKPLLVRQVASGIEDNPEMMGTEWVTKHILPMTETALREHAFTSRLSCLRGETSEERSIRKPPDDMQLRGEGLVGEAARRFVEENGGVTLSVREFAFSFFLSYLRHTLRTMDEINSIPARVEAALNQTSQTPGQGGLEGPLHHLETTNSSTPTSEAGSTGNLPDTRWWGSQVYSHLPANVSWDNLDVIQQAILVDFSFTSPSTSILYDYPQFVCAVLNKDWVGSEHSAVHTYMRYAGGSGIELKERNRVIRSLISRALDGKGVTSINELSHMVFAAHPSSLSPWDVLGLQPGALDAVEHGFRKGPSRCVDTNMRSPWLQYLPSNGQVQQPANQSG